MTDKYKVTEKAPKPGTVKSASAGRVFSIQGKAPNYGSEAPKTTGLTVTNGK